MRFNFFGMVLKSIDVLLQIVSLIVVISIRLVRAVDAMDNLDEKVKAFFRKCGTVPNLKQDWKDEQMAKILQVRNLSRHKPVMPR